MSNPTAPQALPWLLISDIDETLTGDPEALIDLANAIEHASDRLIFAVNSSRPAVSVAPTLANEFPANLVPAAQITALGTEISIDGNKLATWRSQFSNWPHRKVFELLTGLGHVPHDPVYQTAQKVSFAIRGERSQIAARRALSDAGIECRIIVSGDDDFDVIPTGAGKAAATRFLAAHFGTDLSHLVVAGDSGNDLDMFQAARHRIAVGNARKELIDALEPGSFYHARNAHAAGVREGLVHFGALPGPD
ncbi:MAG: HAD family hydrolase [Silicimonas sp.]|nr:HAD family hydrolase [Silicimonas sp.]MBT8425537.1 HAD family hydrolase [Silicimonas sp.]NND18319.1 HAD-IIB family hydrolase [Silicimonas sp.]NND21798.1 HAD-IIB family hydrolase [Silicimonas sp.]NND43013.1 HAD-IIB family hydrolase [Silicimonas sp.]